MPPPSFSTIHRLVDQSSGAPEKIASTILPYASNEKRLLARLRQLFRECLFIHYVQHLRDVAAIVAFEHIAQSLDATSRHSFVGVRIQSCNGRRTGKMREQAATVLDGRIA